MARFVAWFAAAGHILAGLWAMLSPTSFFEKAAVFEPYNQHFIQDVGAFLIGLGAVLVLSLILTDPLAISLLGVGVASAAHTVSHVVGRDLGGEPSRDIPSLVLMTALLLGAGATRARAR